MQIACMQRKAQGQCFIERWAGEEPYFLRGREISSAMKARRLMVSSSFWAPSCVRVATGMIICAARTARQTTTPRLLHTWFPESRTLLSVLQPAHSLLASPLCIALSVKIT